MVDDARIEDGGKGQSSLSTVFSVWNTMVGSSLVSIPWAFENTGIILGIGMYCLIKQHIVISTVVFLVAFYTCSLILKTGKQDSDFADTVYKYYGKI